MLSGREIVADCHIYHCRSLIYDGKRCQTLCVCVCLCMCVWDETVDSYTEHTNTPELRLGAIYPYSLIPFGKSKDCLKKIYISCNAVNVHIKSLISMLITFPSTVQMLIISDLSNIIFRKAAITLKGECVKINLWCRRLGLINDSLKESRLDKS